MITRSQQSQIQLVLRKLIAAATGLAYRLGTYCGWLGWVRARPLREVSVSWQYGYAIGIPYDPKHTRAWLDGKEITRNCVYASEIRNKVVVCERDDNGVHVINAARDGLEYRTLYGRVAIDYDG